MAGGVVAPNAIPATNTRRTPLAVPIPGDRWEMVARWLTWGAFGVVLVAAALAPILRTGDAHQYYAMATALADQRPPALTGEEVAAFKAWLQAQPADAGFASSIRAVDQPPLLVDGRQEFSHFWFYPLLVAPAVALTTQVDLHPGYAFLVVNAVLLAFALWQVQRAFSAVVSLLVLASPLIWFVNKAQVEIFTVSLLCIAMAQARQGRWTWAALAAAIASTQNAPILIAVACFWGAGLFRQLLIQPRRPITPGGVALVLLTIVIGALHPAYYLWRLGVLTPQRLNGGISFRLPTPEQYLAVLIDPDIGLLPWLPLTGLVALAGIALIWRPDARHAPPAPQFWREHESPGTDVLGGTGYPVVDSWSTIAHPHLGGTSRNDSPDANLTPSRIGGQEGRASRLGGLASGHHSALDLRLSALCAVVIGLGFLFVFAQTTNVNSGGTVHISRYALWLLPLTLPFLEATTSWLRLYLPALLPVAAGVALIAYGVVFQPGQREQYVTQSPQAAFITTWLPELYRTVPEIFYERHQQADGGVRGTAATATCRVILIQAESREQPCPLSPTETDAVGKLFANDWHAAWIFRPGPLGLGEGGVFGALPRP